MNFRLLSKLLGIVSMLIGATMIASLIWAIPTLGVRQFELPLNQRPFEWGGFWALVVSIIICLGVGVFLIVMGRKSEGRLFRKEAMAVVGLSWVLATVLGALPFFFSGVERSPSIRLMGLNQGVQVFKFNSYHWRQWSVQEQITDDQYAILLALHEAGAKGLSQEELAEQAQLSDSHDRLAELAETNRLWRDALLLPEPAAEATDRDHRYRIRWVPMGIIDSLFESQSGFSTTGATVISDLEDPELIPHCILFWRSSTHFLGGLGIIVLFVTILGQGSAGKALMRAEMPGPTKEGATARMQHTAWLFAFIYLGLNFVLTLLLWFYGMTLFDALCHAFGTMATGGFSTYNASLGHFYHENAASGVLIEYTVILFMLLAGSNFTLLYLMLLGKPKIILADVEWRTYMITILGVSLLVLMFGLACGDWEGASLTERISNGIRYGLFQVVSIITTTGFGTHDFDQWNSFGRGVLFLLMFVGGCAGSTGGGMKVIRHILFLKILRLEVEQAYHPSVVRPLRLGGEPVEDPDLRKNILVYFGLILVIFVFSWFFVVTFEPDQTWGTTSENKLIDSASGVAATLNNIGPGLGTVGATQNYAHFSWASKLLFTWLMMIGRLEIFTILVLFSPNFWRNR